LKSPKKKSKELSTFNAFCPFFSYSASSYAAERHFLFGCLKGKRPPLFLPFIGFIPDFLLPLTFEILTGWFSFFFDRQITIFVL